MAHGIFNSTTAHAMPAMRSIQIAFPVRRLDCLINDHLSKVWPALNIMQHYRVLGFPVIHLESETLFRTSWDDEHPCPCGGSGVVMIASGSGKRVLGSNR